MNAPLTPLPSPPATEWQWSDEVLAFAKAHGVESCLEPMLAATRRLFPTANWIKVYVEQDPELRDERYLVFDVQVAGLTLDYVRQADREWNKTLLACLPRPIVCAIVLLLDLQP
jgi:hypothetical protein